MFWLGHSGPLAQINPIFCAVDNATPPLPIGTRVVVRLRESPGTVTIPKMRWIWAVYTLFSQKERSASQGLSKAIFRFMRLRDRTVKLVDDELLHVLIYRHNTFKPSIKTDLI